MLIASLLVLFLALRGLRSSETFGVQVGAIATVGILLGLDTWSIQTAYHALGMEIREAGFYLAPAGAALLAAGALLIYVGRRKWFLAGMLTVLVLTGAYAEVNLVR